MVWLSAEEKKMILTILQNDRAQQVDEGFNWTRIKSPFSDWRVWLWVPTFMALVLPVYSVLLSLPSIVADLGYHDNEATLMACPPYVFGVVLVIITGYTSDRYKQRYLHVVAGTLVAMVALVCLITIEDPHVRYWFYFLQMAMFIPVNQIWTWSANNFAGNNRRSVSTAILNCGANIGGAISGQIYRTEWKPRYLNAHYIMLGAYTLGLVFATVLYFTYKAENARRDREHGVRQPGDMEGVDLGDLGDKHPDFRYYT